MAAPARRRGAGRAAAAGGRAPRACAPTRRPCLRSTCPPPTVCSVTMPSRPQNLHRFPNYFGEMTLWWGVFITCTGGLSGAQFASVASPLFVMALLFFVSGIPLQVREGTAPPGPGDAGARGRWARGVAKQASTRRATLSRAPQPSVLCCAPSHHAAGGAGQAPLGRDARVPGLP